MDDFLPILAKGEEYIEPDKSRSGPPIDDSRLPSYEEARDQLKKNIHLVRESVKEIPDNYRVKDIIVNMKMTLGYTAKSFHPYNLIRLSGAKDVGSKKWTGSSIDKKGKEKISTGKNIFLRMSEEALFHFDNLLDQREGQLIKSFIADVRKIDDFFIGDNKELLQIFSPEWNSGRIELVLHPFGDLEEEVHEKFLSLFEKFGGEVDKIKYRSYAPGPTFISAFCKKETLEQIIKFNPIRTAHPLLFNGLPKVRGSLSGFPLPNPPKGGMKSSIIVGMFDGGVTKGNPLLEGFVNVRDPITTSEHSDDLEHGVAVAGSILYGNLQGYSSGSTLPLPPVTVESYRVLPLSDPKDYDLYEVIDIIEEVVPKRNDIKVFNLSLGPYGPIEDDYISRFTYVIDSFSEKGERLFCVAVGNDGDMPDEDDRRIQAPSDTINGLGVGAYTFDHKNSIQRAPYSCIGEGREGCKIKPDIVAFGGCENHPFHLVGLDGKNKFLAAGTSFASPLVASKAAELIGRCNVADPLVARTLIVHSAVHPNKVHDKYLGYGAIPNSVEEILGCSPNKITVLYKNRILPTKYAKVNIPFVEGLDYKGRVEVSWTITIATKPNPLHTEDYTTNCIEDIFYPNSNVYYFTSPDKKHNWKRDVILNKEEVEQLELQGWKKSTYPVTASGNQYKSEDERRADFKWDTVVKKSKKFNYKSLSSPYIVLHAMDRNAGNNSDFIYYAVAVTVHYLDYKGNAYNETLKNYNKLEMATLRSMNEIMVR
ncbi:S8 family peptidase [Aneurinibacillus aneurinilyticus]|uniref:S8 family peptidase n=1 Tax=Aneurinibacillus aneurinilyticus TaxID=1391 RepID=UPI002E213218|nr:S8 family peptidase [Aneurinibacillus aneurinilyticus]